jgi:DNA/RNA-binding domain of Phe-tRNA-synthetase-like protein
MRKRILNAPKVLRKELKVAKKRLREIDVEKSSAKLIDQTRKYEEDEIFTFLMTV